MFVLQVLCEVEVFVLGLRVERDGGVAAGAGLGQDVLVVG